MTDFITQEQLAERWLLSEATLERDRSLKQGVRYLKIGGLIRYKMQDVLDYEQQCTVETKPSTSKKGAKHDDRELLELAAKAAGIEYDETCTEKDYKFGLWLTIHSEPYEGQRRKWNPLTDDGDALRLAVKLKIDVKHYDDYVVGWFDGGYIGTGKVMYEGDPCAATRQAIVRAAAEIGKESK